MTVRVTPVSFGLFALDGGAMFGIIPKTLWNRRSPADEKNRISLGLKSLLIEGPGFKALIDAGMGSKWDETSEERFCYKNQNYETLLWQSHNIKTQDITHVLLTHLHFDHAGGLTRQAPSGELEAVFPNAEVLVHEANLRRAEHATAREKGSYRSENWDILKKSGRLRSFRGTGGDLLAGIRFEKSDGHTEGQSVYHMDAEDGHTVFVGDLMPTSAHLDPVWGMGYDTEPLKLLEEKTRLLEEAVKNNWRLAFPHDPKVAWRRCQAGEKKNTYTWAEGG